MPATMIADRYAVVAELGQGAMGQVLKVVDPQSGVERALKIMLGPCHDAARAAFRQEFQVMARLAHERVVRVFDYGEQSDGTPFFTMEIVPGPSLDAILPLDPEQAREALVQLLEALGYLHRQGLVHGDLKPENLRLDAECNLKLMDFGLLRAAGQSGEPIQGTPYYVAPEVIRQEVVDGRADLYSAGCVFYHLLSGVCPFDGPEVLDVVSAHLRQRPVPLLDYRHELPSDLVAVIERLMARAPQDRFASAEEALRTLGVRTDGAHARLLQAPFIGRDAELSALGALVSDARQGASPRVGVVAGEPGMGKTRLLEAFRVRAQLEGERCVRVAAVPGQTPYAPLVELIQALLPAACAMEPALAERAGTVLAAFYPGLETHHAEDPRLFKLQLGELLGEVLRACADEPLVVILDQWDSSDEGSRSLASELPRRLAGVPVVLLYGVCDRAVAPDGTRVVLGPLSETEAEALILGVLGMPVADKTFVSQLVAHVGGNPQALQETLSLLHARAQLRARDAQWECTVEVGKTELPVGLQGLAEAKLAALGPGAARAARFLAHAARPLEAGLLASCLGEDAAVTGILELIEAAVVTSDGRSYALRSGAIARRLIEGTDTREASEIYEALFRATLEAQGAEQPTLEIQAALARYAVGARLGLVAARHARLAAEAALGLYAVQEARRWLEAAFESLGSEAPLEERIALGVLQGDAHRHSGETQQALDIYDEVLARAAESGRRLPRVQTSAGICLTMLANESGAEERLRAAIETAEREGVPAEGLRATTYLARLYATMGNAPSALALLEPALSSAEVLHDRWAEATCKGLLGLTLTTLAPERIEEGMQALQAAIAIHRERRDPLGLNDAYMLLGNAQLQLGLYQEAEASFKENLRYCRELSVAPGDLLMAETNLALVALERGLYEQAAKELGSSAIAFAQAGDRFFSAYVRAAEGLAHAFCGRAQAAGDAAMDAEAIAEMLDSGYLRLVALGYAAEAGLVLGRSLQALEKSDRAIALARAEGASDWLPRLLVTRAEALYALDDPERSAEALEEALTAARSAKASGLISRCGRLKGVLAFEAEQLGRAADELEGACRAAELSGQHGVLAEVAFCRARVAGARGEAAADWLARARSHAEQGGYLGLMAEAFFLSAQDEPVRSLSDRYMARAHDLIAQAVEGLSPSAVRSFLSVGERRAIHDHLNRLGRGPETAAVRPSSLSDVMAMTLGDVLGALGAPKPTAFPDARMLAEFEDLVSGIGDADALSVRIARWLTRRTSAQRALVVLFDPEGREAARSESTTERSSQDPSFAPFAERFVSMVRRDRRMLRLVDSATGGVGDQRTVLAIPLLHLQELLGVIYVDALVEARALGDEDVALLQTLASYASVGVFNARLLTRTEEALRSAQALSEVAKAVASTMELSELAETLLRQCLKVTGAEHGYVLMGGALEPLAAQDLDGRPIHNPQFSHSIARRVLTTCKAIVMTDAPESLSASDSVFALEIQSVMCVPLVVKDVAFGVIYVSSHATRLAFGDQHLSILEAIAAQAALSVNNALLFQDLRDTLNRERQALLDKAKMARYMSSAARQAAEAAGEEIDFNGSLQMATMMFADVRGFTTLSERLDPHAVVSILNTYMTRMERIITGHGGILDKFIGDGIMAVFLPDESKEKNEAVRAAEAGIAMQRAVAEMNDQGHFPSDAVIRIGIGINSGEVVAGNIGSSDRMDYTVIGDNVNLAARLESNAKPGQVLVSARTAGLIGDRLAIEPMGTLTVKGKSVPVEVYQVRSSDS